MTARIDYRTPGDRSDLGELTASYEIPSDPRDLFTVVQGLVVHEGVFRGSGLVPNPGQLADWDADAGQILAQALALDDAPLTVSRPLDRRVAGQCFHSALLYCALLRHRGLPARARCGFASYFQPGS